MSTWLKVTLNILLGLILIAVSVIFTLYTDTFDKHKRYTYDDLQEAHNIGYEKASTTITELQAKIKELEDLITLNDSNITEFQEEISKLKSELEIYINDSVALVTVTLYVDEAVHQEISVRQNGSILTNIETPTKAGYTFIGWSDGENIVDCTTYKFTEDTSLNAVFEADLIGTCNITANFAPLPIDDGLRTEELNNLVIYIVITGGVENETYNTQITYWEPNSQINGLTIGTYSVEVTCNATLFTASADITNFEISNEITDVTINISLHNK